MNLQKIEAAMISGIFPPLPTPFVNNSVSLEKLSFNIKKLEKFPLAGYVVMGSNGEAAFLSTEEKLAIVEIVRKTASRDKKIIAGTGVESISETIKLTNLAAERGAEYALILTPSYYQSKMNDAAQTNYFTSVADGIKIPLIIYNVPKFTGININYNVVGNLAVHPNIVGIKNSSENIADLAKIISMVPKDFSVLVGTASIIYPGILLGATGAIAATANIAPKECCDIQHFIEQNHLLKSKELQLKLLEINTAVTSTFGIAGLKYVMDKLGYFGGIPREPLLPLSENEKCKLDGVVDKFLVN